MRGGGNSPQTPLPPRQKSGVLSKIGSDLVVKPYQYTTFRNFADFFTGAHDGLPVVLWMKFLDWADAPERQDEVRLPRDLEILSRYLLLVRKAYEQPKILPVRPQVHRCGG